MLLQDHMVVERFAFEINGINTEALKWVSKEVVSIPLKEWCQYHLRSGIDSA